MTVSTFPQVPLMREPTRTPALDPGASGSALIFPTFGGTGPWRLVSHSHGPLLGAFSPIYPVLLHSQPRDVPLSFATYGLWPSPHSSPLIPFFYPTRPPATQWRGPTGSSSVRGPFRSFCTGCSYPAPLCLGCLFPVGLFEDFLRSLSNLLPGPVPVSHPSTHAYTPPGRLHPMCIPKPAACYPSQVGAPPLRHSQLLPLPSPLPALPPSPVSRPSPLQLLCCPVYAALLLSAPGLFLARPHASLRLRPVLHPVGRLGRPPQVPLREDTSVVPPAGLSSISSLMTVRRGQYSSMRVIGMVSLCWRCGAPDCRCSPPAPLPRRAAVSRVRACFLPFVPLVPRSSPLTRALRVSPAPLFSTFALPPLPLSLRHVPSPLPTTSPRPNPLSHGGASLAQLCQHTTVCYHCTCCTPSWVVHSRVRPMPYADAPTLAPGVRLYPEASSPGPPMWVCVVWHDVAVWPTEPPA